MIEESPAFSHAESALAEAGLRHGIEDFGEISKRLEGEAAEERVRWALDHFGDSIGMTSASGRNRRCSCTW